MAILNDGINGGFTGKVGSIIGYRRLGKWVIKGLPKPSARNKKGSSDQKVCRNRFTVMQTFLSPILGYIRVGFNLESKARMITAHNAAMSYNMLHAFHVDNEIDFSKLVLTHGKLIGPESPQHFLDQDGVHFTWTPQLGLHYERANDQVMLLAYNAKANWANCIFSGARRKSGKETLALPKAKKGDELHTWISFVSDDRMSISMSTYVGMLVYP